MRTVLALAVLGAFFESVSMPCDAAGLRSGASEPRTEQKAVHLSRKKSGSEEGAAIVWPQALNEFFGTGFARPDYAQVLDAMVARLNRRTVNNVAPQDEYDAFRTQLAPYAKSTSKREFNPAYLDRLYRTLVEYVAIEAEFARKPRTSVLERMILLVRDHAKRAPGWDPARTDTVIEAMERKEQLVPSSILFGRYVLPYRPRPLPAGSALFEVPAAPQYRDSRQRIEVHFDSLAPVGPVYRIDFETAGPASLLLEESHDGLRYRSVLHTATRDPGGLRAPIFVEDPFLARHVAIRVTAFYGRAVFRNARLYALKEAPRAVVPRADALPVVDGVLGEEARPSVPEVYGFVLDDGHAFAGAPTTLRLSYSPEALYIVAHMHDARPETMVATEHGEEEPFSEEEFFEVYIDTGSGKTYRFAVNPMGARSDSRDGSLGWDGAWGASTTVTEAGWVAEIALPFSTLEDAVDSGTKWKANFVRNRVNVVSEGSAWAVSAPRGIPATAWGILLFD